MLSDLIDSPDVLAVYSSPEASVSPPQPVDDANVVESLDNIRSNVAAVIRYETRSTYSRNCRPRGRGSEA